MSYLGIDSETEVSKIINSGERGKNKYKKENESNL